VIPLTVTEHAPTAEKKNQVKMTPVGTGKAELESGDYGVLCMPHWERKAFKEQYDFRV
jgi:hypothetical protein